MAAKKKTTKKAKLSGKKLGRATNLKISLNMRKAGGTQMDY